MGTISARKSILLLTGEFSANSQRRRGKAESQSLGRQVGRDQGCGRRSCWALRRPRGACCVPAPSWGTILGRQPPALSVSTEGREEPPSRRIVNGGSLRHEPWDRSARAAEKLSCSQSNTHISAAGVITVRNGTNETKTGLVSVPAGFPSPPTRASLHLKSLVLPASGSGVASWAGPPV